MAEAMGRQAGGIAMQQAYRRYARAAAVAFVLVTLYTVPTKLRQGRLGHDWAHSVLHLGSAVVAAYAGWLAHSSAPARAVTWAVGIGYLALGVYGWFTPGLLLGTPLAIPLGVPENLFHLLLSLPALAVALLQLRSASRHVPERG
jgi:uncharacterized membrane protein YfcA